MLEAMPCVLQGVVAVTRLTKADIVSWADTRLSAEVLPELIRRLIITSNRAIEKMVIPYGNSIGRSGLDGFVHTKIASTFVPDGESIWEFGTNKDHVSKANSDFEKRTIGTASFRQEELSYRCVTPRHWEKKADWEEAPGSSNPNITSNWKDVRAYDVDDILGWLSDCPSVEAWFSRKLGKASAGFRDAEGYWGNVARANEIELKPTVLLANRHELATEVQRHFSKTDKPPKPLAISCRSPGEVIPFVVASIIDSEDEMLIASTIIVDLRNRWEQLIVEESGLRLVVAPQVQPTREELQQAYAQGHWVVYCAEESQSSLPRLSEFELRNALIASGIQEAYATQYAKYCGGNGQLLLDRFSGLQTPTGTAQSQLDDRVKVTCLLLNAWNGDHIPDRELFTILTDVPYDQIEAILVSDSKDPDGLLFRADGKYRLLSPELAWSRYGHLVTKSVASNFADVVTYILMDDDPAAELSGTARLAAQLLGQRPELSSTLRNNVVHSLAIATSMHSKYGFCAISQELVDGIVRHTLKEADFQRWASFRSDLAIIAEAAPDVLLDALERDSRPSGPFEVIMGKADSGVLGTSPQIGILWALERLSWSPLHLDRAIGVLLRLVAFNPEIKHGNNPTNSIVETLQLHCPQTNSQQEVRHNTIRRMLELDTASSFAIAISLFSGGSLSWTQREFPLWRDWAYGYEPRSTNAQFAIERSKIVDELILFAADDANRWCSLVVLAGDIDDDQYDRVLDLCEARLEREQFDESAKRLIWETLNAMLIRLEWTASRRRLSNREVVDENELDCNDQKSEPHFPREVHCQSRFGNRLREIRVAAIPSDLVLANCHAFLTGPGNSHCSRHFSDRFNYEQRQKQIAEARLAAARVIGQREGLAGLQRLAAIPYVDAIAVGRNAYAAAQESVNGLHHFVHLFASTTKSDQQLATGYVAEWAWATKESLAVEALPLTSTISDEKSKAAFLRSLPFVSQVWDCVDAQAQDVQRFYWRSMSVPWEISDERLPYFVNRFVEFARADRAIELLSRRRKSLTDNSMDLIFDSLEGLPNVVRDADESKQDNLRWEIQQLFEVLYGCSIAQVERLVRLELLYHDIFEIDEATSLQPIGSLTAIRDSPQLFVDMLQYAYRNDLGEAVSRADSDPKLILNTKIRRLLKNLSELPGQSDRCQMNGATTATWVAEVMRIATDRRYVNAALLQISTVISSRAWKSISSWPRPEIEEVINFLCDLNPEDFRQQLSNSLFYARGTHFVDPTGNAEKIKAAEFHSRSKQLQLSCPAASFALREVAKSLESEVVRNIERARWEL